MTNGTAIVTGGAGTLGLAISRSLRDDGWSVIILDRQEALANFSPPDGMRADALDVTDFDACRRYFAKLTELSVLVNNAGMARLSLVRDISLEDWNQVLDLNLTAPLVLTQLATDLLVRSGHGAIVNIASNHAGASVPGFEMYAATKGGIVAMSRAMATSLAPQRIRVNTLSPGFTLNAPIGAALERDPALLDAYRALHPAQRINEPADIGRIAAFLLSDAAAGIAGADLVADNGMSALLFNRTRSST